MSKGHAVVAYRYMSQRDRITRGFKKALSETEDVQEVTHESLQSRFGLVVDKTMQWYDALDLIDPSTREYIRTAERKNQLGKEPRIKIGTIHSVKGKEADNVVLRPEMSYRTWRAYQRDPDPEHRVWYVGVTRARNRLILLHPSQSNFYPL